MSVPRWFPKLRGARPDVSIPNPRDRRFDRPSPPRVSLLALTVLVFILTFAASGMLLGFL